MSTPGIQEIGRRYRALLEFITDFDKAVNGSADMNSVKSPIARAKELGKFHFAVAESQLQVINGPELGPLRALRGREHESN